MDQISYKSDQEIMINDTSNKNNLPNVRLDIFLHSFQALFQTMPGILDKQHQSGWSVALSERLIVSL